MPFFDEITGFINDSLKASSLNSKKLQPAKFYGLSTQIYKSVKDKNTNNVEPYPAIVDGTGAITVITPDDKYSLQVYHKNLSNAYSYEKESYGDGYLMNADCDMQMVVITNGKISGKTKEILEPVFIAGMPQKLSQELITGLGIYSCLITPAGSNMDAMQVFRQEYPKSNLFLTNQMSMFLIRYRIKLTFSQTCIDKCLCG